MIAKISGKRLQNKAQVVTHPSKNKQFAKHVINQLKEQLVLECSSSNVATHFIILLIVVINLIVQFVEVFNKLKKRIK